MNADTWYHTQNENDLTDNIGANDLGMALRFSANVNHLGAFVDVYGTIVESIHFLTFVHTVDLEGTISSSKL